MARKQKRTGPIPEIDHTQKAYMGIRRMLFHNEIGPGQKISYRDLAERLKMSSTPVIQAFKQLEFQELVRHEPNHGYYKDLDGRPSEKCRCGMICAFEWLVSAMAAMISTSFTIIPTSMLACGFV